VVRDTVTHEFLGTSATGPAAAAPTVGGEGPTPRPKGAHLR
jgi:hypothetical protein